MKYIPETIITIPDTEAIDALHVGTFDPWGKSNDDEKQLRREGPESASPIPGQPFGGFHKSGAQC